MSDRLIKSGVLTGEIDAIPSKSYAHRIAICNYLANNENISGNSGDFSSVDIKATEQCLLTLKNGGNVLDCEESGSTLRFLIPLALIRDGEYKFIGRGKLMDRPNDELFECLKSKGIRIEKKDGCIVAKGVLTCGEYKIRGDISSQYISGLLMALPTLDGDSRITLLSPLASSPYVDITLQVLKNYGVNIEKDKDGFKINGNAKYCGQLNPEGDWSNSAFFLVAGAIAGNITLKGLNIDSVQGDKFILDILEKAGARIEKRENKITVEKSLLSPFSFDAGDCPDLVPIASVLASFAKGETTIKNIGRLRIKESNRIESTISMLNAFGIKARENNDSLIITGGSPKSGQVSSFNDHRIAMSASIMAIASSGESKIIDSRAVNKSYPTFYNDLERLGGVSYEL